MPSVFIGLGPNGRDIQELDLKKVLEEFAPISTLRMRGTCAFADVANDDDANKLIEGANNMTVSGARLSVQLSRGKDNNSSARGGRSSGPVALFIGLGPSGSDVSDDDLRKRLEEVAPVLAIRRRGQCAFVDVSGSSDAEKMIQELRGQMLGPCRLSVQYSKDSKVVQKRGRSDSRDRRRDDSRDRRRRSDSRDRRRRDSRGREDSRDRRRRDDSREPRRRRSPSY